MAAYVGNQSNPSSLVSSIEHIKTTFDPQRHAPVKAAVQAFLTQAKKYLAAANAVTAAEKKETAARNALSDADAARDAAVDAIDRKLIAAGADKKNSFKQYKLPPPAAVKAAVIEKESALVAQLVKAVAEHLQESRKLAASNAAVATALTKKLAAEKASVKARAERDAKDRPTRAGLSVLKLQVKTAEKLGLVGAYKELFEIPSEAPKKSPPAAAAPA
jgi:hypothetical protein